MKHMHYPIAGIAIAQISPAVRVGKAAYWGLALGCSRRDAKDYSGRLAGTAGNAHNRQWIKSRSEAPTRGAQDP